MAHLGRKRLITQHGHNHICGCYYILPRDPSAFGPEKRQYLSQVKLDSHTTINPVCFTTSLTQIFHNPNQDPLPQVRYTFPLFDGVCVSGYTVSYAGKQIRGIVQQKDDAKQIYQAAVDRGETAGLLDALPAGVFGVSLGNVPNGDVVVNIVYCGELKHDAAIDGLRYMLPTSIAPRYGDYPGSIMSANAVTEGGISITVDINMGKSAIRKAQSPSHPIAIAMGATSAADQFAAFEPSQACATLALGSTDLGGDFILQIMIDDISKPQAIIESHPDITDQRALMMTLVPKFALPMSASEIVFIADQSGSMSGEKNAALMQALRVFLKSLPFSTKFNIVAFGNEHESLWPRSQAYNEINVETALAFVDGFEADYGGTEVLAPIKATFERRLGDLPLEVMLLTDGEIWNEPAVFSYIKSKLQSDPGKPDANARIFSLGIGSDVSHSLIEGVARAGHGFAQFITQNEDADTKVLRMLKCALYAHTKDYELEVHYQDDQDAGEDEFEIIEKIKDCLSMDDGLQTETSEPPQKKQAISFFDPSAVTDKRFGKDPGDRYSHLPSFQTPKILQAPSEIPVLFPYNRTTLYLLQGPRASQRAIRALTLRAKSVDGTPLELSVPVQATNSGVIGAATVHHLAARKAIQDLEEGRGWLQAATVGGQAGQSDLIKDKHASRFDEIVEREAVSLGVKFQVAGRWTSFVAVQQGNGIGTDISETHHDDQTAPAEHRGSGQIMHARMASVGHVAPRKKRASKVARESAPSSQNPIFASGMHNLIAMQTFSGAWGWNADLVAFFGIDEQKFGELVSSCSVTGTKAEKEMMVATAMAVAWFEKNAAKKRDVWEMVVEKARVWLSGQVAQQTGGNEKVQCVIDFAKSYV